VARFLGISVLALVLCAGVADARDVWTEPYPGVRHLERTVASPANRIHAVTVDLSRKDLRLRATRRADRDQIVSNFAQMYGCKVAVNGDFFDGNGLPVGLAMGAGQVWSGSADDAHEGFFAVGRDNRAVLSLPADVAAPQD
jgi:hypothetical protein